MDFLADYIADDLELIKRDFWTDEIITEESEEETAITK